MSRFGALASNSDEEDAKDAPLETASKNAPAKTLSPSLREQQATPNNAKATEQRWICVKHSRFVPVNGRCYGDIELQGSHARDGEPVVDFEEGSRKTDSEAAMQTEEELHEFLRLSNIIARRFRARVVNYQVEEVTDSREKRIMYELDAVVPALETKTTLHDLFLPILQHDGKVRRAGRRGENPATLEDDDCKLAVGSRVFFEVTTALSSENWVNKKCLFKAQAAQAFNKLYSHKGPSVLVYVFNGGDPAQDWEAVFRKNSDAEKSKVFTQIVFIWCGHACALGTKLEAIQFKMALEAEQAKTKLEAIQFKMALEAEQAKNAEIHKQNAEIQKQLLELKKLVKDLGK